MQIYLLKTALSLLPDTCRYHPKISRYNRTNVQTPAQIDNSVSLEGLLDFRIRLSRVERIYISQSAMPCLATNASWIPAALEIYDVGVSSCNLSAERTLRQYS